MKSDFDDILAPESCCHKFLKNPKFGRVSWLFSEILKKWFFAILDMMLWMDLGFYFFKSNFFLFSNFWHRSRCDGTAISGSNFNLKFFSEKAKNVLLTKNPQFLSDWAQILCVGHENFRDQPWNFELNRRKNVDFLLIALFLPFLKKISIWNLTHETSAKSWGIKKKFT